MLRKAWASATSDYAIQQLRSLATGLQTQYPDASESLREGLEETITILGLSITGLMKRILCSTNNVESAFSMVA